VSEDAVAVAGRAALAEARRLFALDVYDPPLADKSERADHSRFVINLILQASGWGWQMPYKGDGQVEWCGLFVAACWRAAGIDPKWLARYFASTYRLDLWGSYRSFDQKLPNPRPKMGPFRKMAILDPQSLALPFVPQAGDILVVGDGVPAAGDHITLVESYDDATHTFSTYEGNGVGVGPDGKRRQGIVRAKRYLGGHAQRYCARRLIRPAPSDLLTAAPL
jgi:hypothetical protein